MGRFIWTGAALESILQAKHAQYQADELRLAVCSAFKDFFMWDTNELDVHVSDIPKLVLRGLDKIHVQRISESQQLSINFVQDTFNSRKRCSS